MRTFVTIAGSDSIGGAGIQADLKTACVHGVYGMSIITALTAQNTLGVQAIHTPPIAFIEQEIDSVFSDIFPDAVKIGMLANREIIQAVARKLNQWQPNNIVLDPVMVSTSSHRLLETSAHQELMSTLAPMASLITPNLSEAEVLAAIPHIITKEQMRQAAYSIAEKTGVSVLVKGGHLMDSSDDLLLTPQGEEWLTAPRIPTENTHGTGCTLSSAIASNLALGCSLSQAVQRGKAYITQLLKQDPHLGHGNGPLNHNYSVENS